ncbi:MAG: hypothetical protein HYV27_13780 [Candidatus Hydrogenedentes bacterium]|nr:hypothetical protein [Candidatus Hydrogenedentota bacterium]
MPGLALNCWKSGAPQGRGTVLRALWGCLTAALVCACASGAEEPGAWGADHVDKPLPVLVEGGECLFCHRNSIGARWEANAHQTTVRFFDPGAAEVQVLKAQGVEAAILNEITMVLGRDRAQRFLKPNGKYGQAAILNTKWTRTGVERAADAAWDDARFAERCAGCHMSGVDRASGAYSAAGIECYTCHGDVPLEHTEQHELAIFSPKRNDTPELVTAICAQCHVRNGTSKATGRPYATHFVPGDNLFMDFMADLGPETIAAMNTGDQHVLANVRAVIHGEDKSLTCMSCHTIHKDTSTKHKKLATTAYCFICHEGSDMKSGIRPAEVHSPVCEY